MKKSRIKSRLEKVQKTLDSQVLAKEGFKKFSKVTPTDTGYAKRNTRLSRDTIVADYGYATVLDRGRHQTSKGMRGSDQAPEGMTKPTIEHIRDFVRKQLGVRL